jgi:excinuclease UvrABC nuclease subunit
VYTHTDPHTQEIVYVGVGTSCRAFRATGSGHRGANHKEWLEAQYHLGKIPVSFVASSLTKEQALSRERELIKQHTPIFNRMHNPNVSFSRVPEKVRHFVKLLRQLGYSYTQISFLNGGDSSTTSKKSTKSMSMWRLVNE